MIQLAAAVSALKAFAEATANQVVTPDEGQRRANICITCPKRRKITTFSLSNVARTLGARANKNRVPPTLKDYKCGVCHCPLLMLVPALPESLHRDSPEEAKERATAPNCWVPAAIKVSS